MSPHIRRHLPVQELIDRLCRKEKALKDAGAFAEANGIRDAVVTIFRMADELDPDASSIDNSESDT